MLVHLPQRLLLGGADRRGMSALGADFFPLREAASEFGHAALVQNPDPRRQGAQQRPVVTHQNDSAVVRFDRVLERLDGFHIQVIGRLVEHQQVRARKHQDGECNARPLAARQRVGAPLDLLP